MIHGSLSRGLVTLQSSAFHSTVRQADISHQILALGLVTISCLFTRYGSGRHQKTVPLIDVVPQLKLALVQRLVYQLALGTTKISLCYFYLRIFTNSASDKWVPYAIMAFVTCYTVALFFVTAFGCIPPSDIWSLAPAGRCTGAQGRLAVIYALGALNISTDILLLVFAIPKICRFCESLGWNEQRATLAN